MYVSSLLSRDIVSALPNNETSCSVFRHCLGGNLVRGFRISNGQRQIDCMGK
jgi:hypothetical protein